MNILGLISQLIGIKNLRLTVSIFYIIKNENWHWGVLFYGIIVSYAVYLSDILEWEAIPEMAAVFCNKF